MAERIEATGGYAKGRNGYFDLHHVFMEAITRIPGTPGNTKVWLHFYSKTAHWPGPCYAVLEPQDAKAIGEAMVREAERLLTITEQRG